MEKEEEKEKIRHGSMGEEIYDGAIGGNDHAA